MSKTIDTRSSTLAESSGYSSVGRTRHLLLGILASAFFVLYALFSLIRNARMGTAAYDLGIFDQAIRSYAHHRAPVSSIKGPGFNLLGDHFHPVLVLLAPLYWIWDDPRTLLLAQAALIAVSVIPVARLAISRLGSREGAALALAYGLSWGIQGAIAFDFHEIAFAVPLMAFTMTALAERRWRTAVAFALPLLLVKEDLGLAVAAVGGYLILQRRVWLGLSAVLAGVTGLLVAVELVIPWLSPTGQYRYWGQVTEGGHQTLTQTVLGLPASLVEYPQKCILLLSLLVITAFAALRSPLALAPHHSCSTASPQHMRSSGVWVRSTTTQC